MSDVVQRTIDDGVALLTLNRPDRLNAWTGEMEREYFSLLDDCAAHEDVRAIVVTGAGRGFCAGADMDALQAIGAEGVGAADHDRRAQTFPLTVPKPILAGLCGAGSAAG
jgi:enoyl-CoA hydratase/carnithine racemase